MSYWEKDTIAYLRILIENVADFSNIEMVENNGKPIKK